MNKVDAIVALAKRGYGIPSDSAMELAEAFDRLRVELARETERAEVAIESLNEARSELAAKEARIAEQEAVLGAINTPLLTSSQFMELERQLCAAENEVASQLHHRTIERGPAQKDIEFKTLEYLRRLVEDRKYLSFELGATHTDNEALRKQLAEFGAGEDTTTMTRKSFAEVLQALADTQAGNEAKDVRMAELEAALRASPAAQRQRDQFERHRYVDRGEPRVMPKDGFINDYD